MSTKIYNGYIINHIDMVTILGNLSKLRSSVYKIAKRKMAEYAAWVAVNQFDKFTIVGKRLLIDDGDKKDYRPNLSQSIWFHASWQIRETVIESFKTRERSALDLECSVVCIPTRSKDKEYTLVLFYDNSPGALYKRSFIRHLKAKDFSYWNNTDRPRGVTDRQWEERGDIWHQAIGADPPCERGFTFECMSEYRVPMIMKDEIIKEAKNISYDNRVDRIAEDYIGSRFVKRKKKFEFSVFNEWRRSKSYAKELEKAKNKVRKMLMKEVGEAILDQPMSNIAVDKEKS